MKLLIPVFSPPSGTWGSLTRVMAIAKKFKNEGHSVAFCASRFVKEALREKGYQAYELPETTMFGLPKFISNIISKKSQKMTPPAREGKSLGNIWALFLLAGYGKKKIFKKMIEAEINAVNAFDPDVILTEMELAAYLTANILNKPIVTTYAHISLKGKDTFFYKIMKRTINSILRKYKKEEAEDLYKIAFGKNVLKLIPSIPELDTTNPDREDICYTGNLLEPIKNTKNKFIPEKGKKYIFCYFGTGSVSFSTIEKVLPIVVNKMENTVCYVASQSIQGEYHIGNVFFVKYIQASELLPFCSLTICHGGLNTITQSIEAGVPLILFPGAIFERRFNAERVKSVKCGFMGELSDFNAEWLSDKIKALKRISIEPLQNRFHEYKGVETAYKRIIEWVQ